MDSLSDFLARNSTQNDPILQMFLQSKENKDIALDYLNQEAIMEDLKKEFINFYMHSIDAVDELFLENFNLKCRVSSPNTSEDFTAFTFGHELKGSCKKAQDPDKHASPVLKKMKLSEDEYIEKLLLDFGYQNEGYNTVSKTDRKALPINDERILIKLNNPKIKLDRDFSPIAEKQEMEIIPPKIENKDPIPPVNETNNSGPSSQIQTQDSKKIVDLSFLQNEISAKNKPEIESHQSQETVSIKEGKTTPSKPALDKISKSPTNDQTRTVETKAPLTAQKEKPELKRSLALDFQEVDKEPEPVEKMNFPGQSQEMGSNRDLEALLCSINFGNPPQQEKTPIGGAKPPTNTNQDKAPSILSSQIHQILYSKPINFIDADSDFDENEEIGRKSSMFYSFEEPCFDDNKENFDINIIEKNEFYNLTDYSSNSSSNENSYIYHEEDESLDGPAKQPKMFNFYDQINMSFKDQCTTCNNVQPNNTQGELYGSQDTNPFANLHTGGLFSNLGSQNPKPMGSQESQNTMFADYVYYLKQRENQMGFDDDIDMIKEKKLSKLKDSPKKKTKRLFCNNKKIPLWATDLKEVEKVSRNQKSMFNSNVIFGFFSVDNLDLVEVFQMSNHRLLKPRGSSANWKNEPQTPSTSKPQKVKSPFLNGLSKTKKNIDFKTFF